MYGRGEGLLSMQEGQPAVIGRLRPITICRSLSLCVGAGERERMYVIRTFEGCVCCGIVHIHLCVLKGVFLWVYVEGYVPSRMFPTCLIFVCTC